MKRSDKFRRNSASFFSNFVIVDFMLLGQDHVLNIRFCCDVHACLVLVSKESIRKYILLYSFKSYFGGVWAKFIYYSFVGNIFRFSVSFFKDCELLYLQVVIK